MIVSIIMFIFAKLKMSRFARNILRNKNNINLNNYKMMKKKLTIMMVALLSLAGLVFAEAFEPTEATTEVLLTKANITDQEYLSVTTDNWQTGKTYGGVTGDFYNMSKEERQLSINVKGVSKFEVFVQNSNAGRSYTVTVGSGAAQTITHNGGGVESSGEIETGTTDEVTITLASDGSGSVYPVKVILTKGEATQPVVEFEDFEITNEQMSGEFDDSTLPACATFSGSKRGDSHGYGNVTLTVFVDRPVKFTIGGCQYANPATCKIIDAAGNVLAEPNLKTENCYHQDKSAATFEYTGEPTTLAFTNIAYLPYFKAEAFEAEQVVEFEDFEITNEQMSGEFDDSTLPACATFSGSKRGDSHGYGNVTLTVFVDRPVKFTIGGCQYANPATCKIIDAAGNVLAEPNLKTENCYHQDKSAATFEYTGEPTTLTFTNIAYLPYFKAEAMEDAPVAQDVTATWDFANNCAKLVSKNEGGSFAGSTMASSIEGIDMTIIYHGGVIMNNDNSYYVGNGVEMQIPVKNKGDIVSVVGYPGYNSYTVGGKEHDGDDMEYTATATDAENGYVSVKSTGRNNYIKSITVTQFAPKEVVTLTDEAATVTFPFHEGTEGQTATFTNDEYWLSSKVTHGSKLTILDKSSKSGIDMPQRTTPSDSSFSRSSA